MSSETKLTNLSRKVLEYLENTRSEVVHPKSVLADPLKRALDNFHFVTSLTKQPAIQEFSREVYHGFDLSSRRDVLLSELGFTKRLKFGNAATDSTHYTDAKITAWDGNDGTRIDEETLKNYYLLNIDRKIVKQLSDMNRLSFLDRYISIVPQAVKKAASPGNTVVE